MWGGKFLAGFLEAGIGRVIFEVTFMDIEPMAGWSIPGESETG